MGAEDDRACHDAPLRQHGRLPPPARAFRAAFASVSNAVAAASGRLPADKKSIVEKTTKTAHPAEVCDLGEERRCAQLFGVGYPPDLVSLLIVHLQHHGIRLRTCSGGGKYARPDHLFHEHNVHAECGRSV